jgi:hypothetical protein
MGAGARAPHDVMERKETFELAQFFVGTRCGRQTCAGCELGHAHERCDAY